MQFPTTSALITGSRRKNKQEKEAMRKSLSWWSCLHLDRIILKFIVRFIGE
jgi:hypothetical protein